MDSHNHRNGFPHENPGVFLFNNTWFIPFSHYTISEHKHFPSFATKAGYWGTWMVQKENWTWELNHSKKKKPQKTPNPASFQKPEVWSSLHLFWHYVSCMAAWQIMFCLFSFFLYFLFLCSATAPCGFPSLQLWSVGGLSFCYLVLLLWHSVCSNLNIINLENKLALL